MLALTPATLGGAHDLLARALVFVVLTSGLLAGLALLLSRRRGPGGAPVPVAEPVPTAEPVPMAAPVLGAGFAGIVAALLAVGLGGPGALPWLVIACLAGAAIHQLEARLAGPLHQIHGTGPFGQALNIGHALAATLAALAGGALLTAQQTAELTLDVLRAVAAR